MLKKIKTLGLLFAGTAIICATAFAAQVPTTLKADVIVYDSSTGVSTAEGNVVITQQDGEARGERAEYNLNTKVGWIEGNVTATKSDARLSAQKVWVRDQNYITAEGSATVSKAGDSVYAPRIDYWSDREFAKTSGGWAKLTQADGSVMTADYMEYDMKKGEGLAERNVTLDAPSRNITGAGDKATYIADRPDKPGEFILTGNAWIMQDGNKIVGDTLIVRSDKTSNEAKGNVRMDIQPKDKPAEEPTVNTSDSVQENATIPAEKKDKSSVKE